MTKERKLRVLVVDDTVLYRKIVSEVLVELPNVEVVGTAQNGKVAVSKIASLKPDLLTLDIEMPEMDGLELLSRMRTEAPDVGAIMLSAFTSEGGEMTMEALELGAFDFILKPQGYGMAESKNTLKESIAPMLRAFARMREIKGLLKGEPRLSDTEKEKKILSDSAEVVKRMNAIAGRKRERSEVVAIGVSTGGPVALAQMLPEIPSDLGVPICIAQHMPPVFTQALAERLDSRCAIKVKEALDREPVRPNTVFIAPGSKQMRIADSADKMNKIFRITDDPSENGCKPSADYLFRSIAQHFGRRATGVIMTGMGSDGTQGLKVLKQKGATIIAQDESTSVVYGMARKPIEEGIVDVIAPLDEIAKEIQRTVR